MPILEASRQSLFVPDGGSFVISPTSLTTDEIVTKNLAPHLIWGLWQLVDWKKYREKEVDDIGVDYIDLKWGKWLLRNRFIAIYWQSNGEDEEDMLILPIHNLERFGKEYFRLDKTQLLATWTHRLCPLSETTLQEVNILSASPNDFDTHARQAYKDLDWFGNITSLIEENQLTPQVIQSITLRQLDRVWPRLSARGLHGQSVFP